MAEVEETRGLSVLAVVVTHDPGRWFGATLDAFAAQDHPGLRVAIVDTGDGDLGELTARVHAVLPDATVHRMDGTGVGFGHAANLAIDFADDVDFLLLCHDDIAPDPHTVSALVAAAHTWDADVVGPKLVAWDEPRRLLQLGLGVDRVGRPVAYVDPGDLDQGQHDEPREVFAVPGACTLIRAELFGRVGGFDDAITFLFDDISLCWRARVAGARVVLAPEARVRHRQGLVERLPDGARQRGAARHRLRTVLSCYGRCRLVRLLPRLAAGTTSEVARGLVLQPSRAAVAIEAWSWNLRRVRSLWSARRRARRFRQVPDRAVVQAQLPVMARAPLAFRRRAAVDAEPGGGPPGNGSTAPGGARGPRRSTGVAVLLVLLAGVLAMGSRHLVTRGVPAVGDLLALGAPGDLGDDWWRGIRDGGGWPDTTVPSLLGAVGGLGALVVGYTELLRTVLILGLIPVGVWGAFGLLRPFGSPRAPALAALAYAAVPVPYTALAAGRWAPLVVYAAAPWMLSALATASGAAPFGRGSAASTDEARARGLGLSTLRAGLATALAALLVPVAPLLLVGMGGALALGALLALAGRAAVRVMVASLGGAGVAIVLHLPWSAQVLRSLRTPSAALVAGAWPGMQSRGTAVSPTDLLRLTPGPGGTALTCGLVAAAGLVLCVGRRWRLAWGVRAWTLALCAGAAIWLLGQADVVTPTVSPDVLLVIVGAAVALAVGAGVAAVERDVAGRSRSLGRRRLLSIAGVVALAVGVVPLVQRSFEGDWDMPTGDFDYLLASQAGDVDGSSRARILWVGHPTVLPGGGWPLSGASGIGAPDGVAYLATAGAPQMDDLVPGPPDQAIVNLGAAVDRALAGETARLGAALAVADIRYVVVPQGLAPSPDDSGVWAAAPTVISAFAGQLDLRLVDVDPALVVYENQAASPVLAAVQPAVGQPAWTSAGPADAETEVSAPALPHPSPRRPWLLGAQVSLWLAAFVVLARARPGWRRSGARARVPQQPREAVRLILPEPPRRDVADILHAGDLVPLDLPDVATPPDHDRDLRPLPVAAGQGAGER